MPKIVINEYDKTTGVSSTIPGVTDIVYIPGFSSKALAEDQENPVMCTSVAEFKDIFGTEPADLSKGYSEFISENEYDPSYIMARELLSMGMPVIYHALGTNIKQASRVDFKATPAASDYELDGNMLRLQPNIPMVISPKDETISQYAVKIVFESVESVPVENDDEGNVTPLYNFYSSAEDEGEATQFAQGVTRDEKLSGAFYIKSNVPCTIRVVGTYTEQNDGNNEYKKADFERDVCEFLDSDYGLRDRSEYSVKYITSGAYANDSLGMMVYSSMQNCAATRGDAVALYEATVTENTDYMTDFVNAEIGDGSSYGACFACAGTYRVAGYARDDKGNPTKNTCVLPGAFGYLITLARNIKTIPNYLATAGVGRGAVPNLISLVPKEKLSQAKADRFTKHSNYNETGTCVNPIAYLNPEGYTIWGNRTLKPVTKAGSSGVSFLNIRNMLSDIKKRAYTVSRARLFEQNSDTLWLDFKSEMIPLLEQLKSGNAISNYKILRSETDANGKRYSREEFGCRIQIIPMYSVEVFSIDVELVDNETNVSGD